MNFTLKKKIIVIVCLVLLFLLGIGITVYPYVSAVYAERVRSEIRTEYADTMEDPAVQEEIRNLKKSAIEYNHELFIGQISPLTPEENGYYDQLKFQNSEIMCYIRIPKIGVELPVYHGTSEAELRSGAGHMTQTSLPVGGESTHCAISAHSGMASSPMFTDIGLLEPGNLVYIETLGETLVYEVYEVPEPVLPHEVSTIQIQEGRDLLTLVTCTPVNVNTHRQLVHCERVLEQEPTTETTIFETVSSEEQLSDDSSASTTQGQDETSTERVSIYDEAYKESIVTGIKLGGLIILWILLILMVIVAVRRRKQRKAEQATAHSNSPEK